MPNPAKDGYTKPGQKLEETILRLTSPKAIMKGAVKSAKKSAYERMGAKKEK